METQTTRNSSVNRNGLNLLGLGTKFDVALVVDSMPADPQAVRHAHPQALSKRCQGSTTRGRMPRSQSISIARIRQTEAYWPTERSAARALLFAMADRGDRWFLASWRSLRNASKRSFVFGSARQVAPLVSRTKRSPGELVVRPEPVWPLS